MDIQDWSKLPMRDRAKFIRMSVARGLNDIDSIRLTYNLFKEGGNTRELTGPVYEVLPKLLEKAGVHVRTTSGKREAGEAGKLGDKSKHVLGEAGDFVPIKGSTFNDIMNALHNDPTIQRYMLSNHLGILDETSSSVMKKTGATGKHIHVGTDTIPAKLYANNIANLNSARIVKNNVRIPENLKNITYIINKPPINNNTITEQPSTINIPLLSSEPIFSGGTIPEIIIEAQRLPQPQRLPLKKYIPAPWELPSFYLTQQVYLDEPVYQKPINIVEDIKNRNAAYASLLNEELQNSILRNITLGEEIDQDKLKRNILDLQAYENFAENGGLLNISSKEQSSNTFKDGGLVNWYHKLMRHPIKQSNSYVNINKDIKGNYTFNGRKPAERYTYYDSESGNTYKFVNGKRTLIKLSDKSKEATKKALAGFKQWEENKKLDEKIAKEQSYGWPDSLKTTTGWNRERLWNNISPDAGISFLAAINMGSDYALNSLNRKKGTPGDEALWRRHLGYERNTDEMPITGIRFAGDFNKDGSLRLPNAEYTGIPNYAKDAIREQIAKNHIKINPGGAWSQREEDTRGYDKRLTLYANFGIRENNNSGIYDMFDTYDFPDKFYMPDLNRQQKKQIEVRDTIWGPNAIPELYDPKFTKKVKTYPRGGIIGSIPAMPGIIGLQTGKKFIRRRLYDNIQPWGYNDIPERFRKAVILNKPEPYDDDSEFRQRALRDDLWATYLQIPQSERHNVKNKVQLVKSPYKPKGAIEGKETYRFKHGLSDAAKDGILAYAGQAPGGLMIDELPYLPENKNRVVYPEDINMFTELEGLGQFTVGRGRDNRGEYISLYDSWDLGDTNSPYKDMSMGIGNPFNIYDRIYLDEYYGVPNDPSAHYLPEVEVIARRKSKKRNLYEGTKMPTLQMNIYVPLLILNLIKK